jgi:FAD/FMN-containing dehydrogenase
MAPVVTRRGEPAYDESLRAAVWQARKPQRFPDAIARVSTPDDVLMTVRDARANGQRVSVRTGGHNFHGIAVRDGGVLIDASALDALVVDAASRTATVGPGVTGSRLGAALDEHGFGFPAPHDHSVAIGGFLLCGGFGLNSGAWGPACFSMDAVDVVTADGELISASEEHHSEYLWAARGAGAAFPGVVTSFRLALRPRPPVLRIYTYVYPSSELGGLSRHVASVLPHLDPSLEVVLVLAPNHVVVRACAWAPDEVSADLMIGPLEAYPARARARGHTGVPRDLTEMTTMLYPEDHRLRPEHRRAVDAFWSDGPIDELLLRLGERLAQAPSQESRVLAVLHSAPVTAEREAAFSMHAALNVEPAAVWSDRVDDRINLEWAAETNAIADEYAVGHYIGSVDLQAHPTRAARCFGHAQWERLQRLRRAVDPNEVFHPLL